jgi:EAL domain-containing protein (putative c-di-GMP-specific phosphodiesterase class I)
MPPAPATIAEPPCLKYAWTLASQTGGASFAILRLPAVLGRSPNCDLRIPEPSVSGRHAELLEHDGELMVRDVGSTNGTFVNGRRVKSLAPLSEHDLLHFGEAIFRVERRWGGEGGTVALTRAADGVCDQALAVMQLDRLLTDRAVTPFYQPITTADSGEAVAYEVLGRSRLFGLSTPDLMFRAAATLNKEAELSRLLRIVGLLHDTGDARPHLYFNTHPCELANLPALIDSLRELREARPQQGITLEIHESAAIESQAMNTLRAALTDLQMGLAYDDFGAGQARLAELAECAPDCVKFDMRLVRDIHQAGEPRRRMLASLVRLVRELDVAPLAEGIESPEEAAVCRDLGFQLFQGYHFGRPAAASQYFGAPAAPH